MHMVLRLGPFFFCYREAICGNSLGTLLGEFFEGTLQEFFGNEGIYLTLLYCTLYKYGRIYYIVITLYYIVSRIVWSHVLYNTSIVYSTTCCTAGSKFQEHALYFYTLHPPRP
jgi:hypothetical protein